MANAHYLYCRDCKAVKQVSPAPECIHFGKVGRTRNCASSMTIFRGPDGQISVPWDDKTPCPKGYEREEIRGARAVRQIERELDAKDIARHRRFQENRQKLFRHDQRREDLKQIISQGVTTKRDAQGNVKTIHVTEFGRKLAREALRRMDSAPTDRYDPGNYRRE